MRYAIVQHDDSGDTLAITAPSLDADASDIRTCGPLLPAETLAPLDHYNYDDTVNEGHWDWDEWKVLRTTPARIADHLHLVDTAILGTPVQAWAHLDWLGYYPVSPDHGATISNVLSTDDDLSAYRIVDDAYLAPTDT